MKGIPKFKVNSGGETQKHSLFSIKLCDHISMTKQDIERFAIVSANFQKTPDDKVCFSEYYKLDEFGIQIDNYFATGE